MDQIAKTYIVNKIEMLLKSNTYQNFDSFYEQNSSFEQFTINHPQIRTIIAHFGLVEEKDYYKIISEIRQKFNDHNQVNKENIEINQDNIQTSVGDIQALDDINNNVTTKKVKVRKLNMNKINGFVDALILAFITGSFLGIIFLNLYSKIVSNI